MFDPMTEIDEYTRLYLKVERRVQSSQLGLDYPTEQRSVNVDKPQACSGIRPRDWAVILSLSTVMWALIIFAGMALWSAVAHAEPKVSGAPEKVEQLTRSQVDLLADEIDYNNRGRHVTVDIVIHRCGPGMSKVYC